jgi:dolichol-phosphate mannosyltransferase
VNQPIYSLVIPIDNEEENITQMYSRIINVMEELDGYAQLILTDDGSGDHSLSMIRELYHHHS